LLDRIDLHIEVNPLSDKELMSQPQGESSVPMRERVLQSRRHQQDRAKDGGAMCNAAMSPKELQRYCTLNTGCQKLLKAAISDLNLSARAYDRILRVSRTIADLAGSDQISEFHISEAIQYRSLDRRLW
jgi:magnesium chelatase family protein